MDIGCHFFLVKLIMYFYFILFGWLILYYHYWWKKMIIISQYHNGQMHITSRNFGVIDISVPQLLNFWGICPLPPGSTPMYIINSWCRISAIFKIKNTCLLYHLSNGCVDASSTFKRLTSPSGAAYIHSTLSLQHWRLVRFNALRNYLTFPDVVNVALYKTPLIWLFLICRYFFLPYHVVKTTLPKWANTGSERTDKFASGVHIFRRLFGI